MDNTKGLLAAGSAVCALIASALGILLPWLGIMTAAMAIDYLTGICAAAWLGKLCSRTGVRGIIKKLAYLFMVMVGVIIDRIIAAGGEILGISPGIKPVVALMLIIWISVNELISILENLGKMEVPLPAFLHRIIQSLHSAVQGDNPKQKG